MLSLQVRKVEMKNALGRFEAIDVDYLAILFLNFLGRPKLHDGVYHPPVISFSDPVKK